MCVVIQTVCRPKVQRHPCCSAVEVASEPQNGTSRAGDLQDLFPDFLTPIPKTYAAAISGIRVIAFFLSWTGGSGVPFELFHRVAYN